MSLRFAILAVLSAEPMTGYELMQLFDDSVGFIWHAPHSNIYPELRRMEAEGLLESEELPRGQRGVKRRYELTDEGFEQLRMQASSVTRPARERDPYRLRAAYLEWADAGAARAQLQAHHEHFTQWRDIWHRELGAITARDTPLLRQRLARTPKQEHDVIVAFKIFAYEGLVAHAEMEIAWASRGLKLVDRLEGDGWKAVRPPRGRRRSATVALPDRPSRGRA